MAIPLINAYSTKNKLFLLHRDDNGRLKKRTVQAEHSCFIPAEHGGTWLTENRKIKKVVEEGDFVRVIFKERDDLNACKKPYGMFGMADIPTFEADVSPVRRFLTDNPIKLQKPKRCYFDLETDSRARIQDAIDGTAKILSWAVSDDDGPVAAGVLKEDTFEAERELVQDLLGVFGLFDQIIGWNSAYFDEPVLKNRCKFLNIRRDFRKWLFLDHMDIFKRLNTGAAKSGDEKTSFALNAISMALLGEGKHDFDSSKTWEAWVDPDQRQVMLEYNIQDAALMPKIEKKSGYLELFHVICETCTTLPDTRGAKPTAFVEGYLMKMAAKQGVRFPNRPPEQDVEQYAGALVTEPPVGKFDDVHVADFASLYPSCIISFNLSPETHSPFGGCLAPKTGERFDNEYIGILPKACIELVEQRNYWKKKKAQAPAGSKEWQDAHRRTSGYKTTINSFYGVIGCPWSRFFRREIAESVSTTGVWLLEQTFAEARQHGMKVLYGDSVTGDRTVVVRDPNGHVRILPIEELFGSATNVINNGKDRGKLDGWLALSADGTGKKWFPINQIIRHKTDKKTYRITTKHGQTQVTSDHGIMVDGKEVTPKEFVKKALQYTKVEPHTPIQPKQIDILDYVKTAVYNIPIRGKKREVKFVPDETGNFIKLNIEKNKTCFKRYYDTESEEFKALLRIIAAYVCDGSASLKCKGACRYMFGLCKSNLALMQQLADDIKLLSPGLNVFGPFWSDTVYVVRSGTMFMACLFDALCGSKCANKRLPPFAFELDEGAAAVFKKGLADGDGYTDAANQLSFTSKSQQLISGVSYFLSQHAFEHSFYFRESKSAWTLRTRGGKERPSRYQIKSEEFQSNNGYVYDLSVEGAHTFADGVGRVLLHNTDSLFVSDCTTAKFDEFVGHCNTVLYPRILEEQGAPLNHVKLTYEKEFSSIIFLAKKCYAARIKHTEGVPSEGFAEEIKGLIYKRSDGAKLARQMQMEAIRLLLERNVSDIEEIQDFILGWKKKILEDDLDTEDFVINKKISRDLGEYKSRTKKDGSPYALPAHVRIAKDIVANGGSVPIGTRISYVIVDGSEGIKAIELSEFEGHFDRFYMWENVVFPHTQRLITAAFPHPIWARMAKARPKKPWHPDQLNLFGE